MLRREFLAAGVAVGPAMAMPGQPLHRSLRASGAWLISSHRHADAVAKAICGSGIAVERVTDDPARLWYDFAARRIAAGQSLRGIGLAGLPDLLAHLVHLQARVLILPVSFLRAEPQILEAWELRPWALSGATERQRQP